MSHKLELQYERNILIEGDILETDESFSHPFGTQQSTGLKISNVKVFFHTEDCFINKDVTALLTPHEKARFEDELLEFAHKQLDQESA